jgi:hypothetical protein
MRRKTGIVLAAPWVVVAACGGEVSLGLAGTQGQGVGASAKPCAVPDGCGTPPLAPAQMCPDGSLGGNTGKCLANADGTCAWEFRLCPPGPSPACFDQAGTLDPAYKKCAVATDCVVVDYQRDCCGSMHAAGVGAASAATVQDCAAKRADALPDCECKMEPKRADDGTSQPGGTTTAPQVACSAAGVCTTTFDGQVCGSKVCTSGETCCSGVPLPEPTCMTGPCPVSRRKYKKDVSYLSSFDEQRLSEELLAFPLATYRYKTENAAEREHLGFIIDDIAPSPAVTANGERVDMYGYQTMAVATLHVQAREIAELRRQIEELKTDIEKHQR